MIWVDWCIVAVILVSILVGLLRGFGRELFNLLSWVLAFALAILFGHAVADLLKPHINEPAIRLACACIALFVAGLIVGSIVTWLLTSWIRDSIFSGMDRSLGAGYGLLRGVFLVTVFVLCAGTMGATRDHWWNESVFVPRFDYLANALRPLVPPAWLDKLKPDGDAPALPQHLPHSSHSS